MDLQKCSLLLFPHTIPGQSPLFSKHLQFKIVRYHKLATTVCTFFAITAQAFQKGARLDISSDLWIEIMWTNDWLSDRHTHISSQAPVQSAKRLAIFYSWFGIGIQLPVSWVVKGYIHSSSPNVFNLLAQDFRWSDIRRKCLGRLISDQPRAATSITRVPIRFPVIVYRHSLMRMNQGSGLD